MMFLQALPTKEWKQKEIELLLSEAYLYQNCFSGAAAHFRKT
jgi:TBC1 domain family member 2